PEPVPAPQPISWAPSPAVLVAACEEAEPAPVDETPEAVEETPEEAEPADPRMVTALVFSEPLPARGQGRAAEIRRRAEAFMAENPDRSQQIIADLVGVKRWSMRDALAATKPTPEPGLRLIKSNA
ncbi:hypothetical protein, partial [Micromonospora sp. KC213]|uniref:hypothetical protein n=1 Tax=Micromonospora sp. KC213 TaxID=2530378 RepID=UPI001A9FE168